MTDTDNTVLAIYRGRLSGVGRCLNCNSHLTDCGRPFTAEIPCRKCGRINVYKESQQPCWLKS